MQKIVWRNGGWPFHKIWQLIWLWVSEKPLFTDGQQMLAPWHSQTELKIVVLHTLSQLKNVHYLPNFSASIFLPSDGGRWRQLKTAQTLSMWNVSMAMRQIGFQMLKFYSSSRCMTQVVDTGVKMSHCNTSGTPASDIPVENQRNVTKIWKVNDGKEDRFRIHNVCILSSVWKDRVVEYWVSEQGLCYTSSKGR